MAEIRRGREVGGTSAGGKGPDRLPWLEPVEDEDYAPDQPGGFGGVILVVIGVLLLFALVTGIAIWWRHRAAQTADVGQIIRAEPDPYKEKPKDAGGMKPAPEGEVAYGTGAGQDIDSPIDLGALPEQPVTGPGSAPRAVAAPARQAQAQAQAVQPRIAPPVAAPPVGATPAVPRVPARPVSPPGVPVPAAPAVPADATARHVAADEAPATGGGVIQLGAFSSQAKAQAAWKSLSRRFQFLAPMTQSILPVQSGDSTLYRLRAGGGGSAGQLCAKLKVAGESCAVVG